jgi:hypothetical protein
LAFPYIFPEESSLNQRFNLSIKEENIKRQWKRGAPNRWINKTPDGNITN